MADPKCRPSENYCVKSAELARFEMRLEDNERDVAELRNDIYGNGKPGIKTMVDRIAQSMESRRANVAAWVIVIAAFIGTLGSIATTIINVVSQ